MTSPTPSVVLWEGHRDADKVVMFGAATKHVSEGSIMSISWSRVLPCAAGVGLVKVTAMGPTIVQIVVFASGSGGPWGGCWNEGLVLGPGLLLGSAWQGPGRCTVESLLPCQGLVG